MGELFEVKPCIKCQGSGEIDGALCPVCLGATEIDSDIASCRICGCTDEVACEGGCSWVEDDLCSECAGGEDL